MNVREASSIRRHYEQAASKQPADRKHRLAPMLVLLVFVASLISWLFLGISHAGAIGSPIKSGWSGYCLDDYKSKVDSGNQVDLWSCNNTAAQDWQVNLTQIMHSDLCLTADSATNITLNTCNQATNQIWLRDDEGFLNPAVHKCLTSVNAGDDQQLTLASCNNLSSAAQKWTPNINYQTYPCNGNQGQRVACYAIKEFANWTSQPNNHEALLNQYTGGTPYEQWCADFVSYIYKEAGTPFTNGNYGWDENDANSIVNQGFNVDQTNYVPKPGDIGYFDYNGGHVEIVVVGGQHPVFIYGDSATVDSTTGNGQMEANTIVKDGAEGQLQYYMSPTSSS